MQETMIGKIQSVKFGYGGYQDQMIGLTLNLGSDKDCWGVTSFISGWWCNSIEADEHTKWTEEDRVKSRSGMVSKINDLLREAKITDVMKLKGVPVEVTFKDRVIEDWRILTEVI